MLSNLCPNNGNIDQVNMKGWRVVLSTDATSCAVKTDDRKDHPQASCHTVCNQGKRGGGGGGDGGGCL